MDANRQEPCLRDSDDETQGAQPAARLCRSVDDFESRNELARALLSNEDPPGNPNLRKSHYSRWKATHQNTQDCALPITAENTNIKSDWRLENYDEASTKQQTVEQELRRLLVLKKYLVLDTKTKPCFEAVTKMAQERFQVPIAHIGLMDLGRQWILSNQGLGDLSSVPRKITFCAHTLAQKRTGCMVVPDASKDVRFQNNPCVTGGPRVHFYAGAPLVSPEGEILGTLCVIDTKPRPHPYKFGTAERKELEDMAAMVVAALVEHRSCMTQYFENLVRTNYPEWGALEMDSLEYPDNEVSRERMEVDDLLQHNQFSTSTFKDKALLKTIHRICGTSRQAGTVPPKERMDDETPIIQKKFRFAEDEHGRVVTSVRRIPRTDKDEYDVWWTPAELALIRKCCIRSAIHIRSHFPDYIQIVEFMASQDSLGDLSPRQLLQYTERLSGLTRGLEMSIVRGLHGSAKRLVQAVLQVQALRKRFLDDTEGTGEISSNHFDDLMREQSLFHSRNMKLLALNLGTLDEVEVLAAVAAPGRERDAQSMAPVQPKRRKSSTALEA